MQDFAMCLRQVSILLLFLASAACVHTPVEPSFSESQSITSTSSKPVRTHTICFGVDAMKEGAENEVVKELTPDGKCYRQTCQGDKCTSQGNVQIKRDREADVSKRDAETSAENTRQAAEYGPKCNSGAGSLADCERLAARIEREEVEKIRKRICARKSEFKCTKVEKVFKSDTLSVGPLVTDLLCRTTSRGTVCTYTDIQPVRAGSDGEAEGK